MHTFLLLLHVVAAVFLIGPLVIAPMSGLRALRLGDAGAVRNSARQTTLYGFLSLLVFGLGAAVVPTRPKEYTYGSPWLIIAMTLYILALLVVLLIVVPALNSASNLLTPGLTPDQPAPAAEPASGSTAGSAVDEPPAAPVTPARPVTGSIPVPLAEQQPEVKGKLDALRGRIAASSGIVAGLMLLTTALMVLKPFGK